MSTSMTLEQLAALVDMPPDQLDEWRSLGLLDPTGRGDFDELDLLRLMTIIEYRARGFQPDRLAKALVEGEVEPFLSQYTYPRGERVSIEEAARRLEIDIDMLRDLRTALGFSRDGLLEDDLSLHETFKVMSAAGIPPDALLEGARVFGDTLRRLAETEIRLVHVHVHERLVAEGKSEEEVAQQMSGLQDAVVPLLDGIVERVHHEHLMLASIEDAYVHLVDEPAAAAPGTVEATVVFIDVESFTQLTESQGDAVAAKTMDRVDSVVRPCALDHKGKVVKQIGDALMLAFRRPADAVRFAAALRETMGAELSLPPIRAGMHTGPAIYRGGDYLGTTVNVASRVTSQATAGEVLMTETVVERAGEGQLTEPAGVRMLRGVSRPLALHRLRAQQREQRDPVCGEMVHDPPAARLREGDEELWFCSQDCLRERLLAAAPKAG
jgi:adenylate cyclase